MELFRPELYFTTFTTMSFSRPALKTFITVLKKWHYGIIYISKGFTSRFKNLNHSPVQDQSPTICQHKKSSFPLTVEAPSISNTQPTANNVVAWELETPNLSYPARTPAHFINEKLRTGHTYINEGKRNIIDTITKLKLYIYLCRW